MGVSVSQAVRLDLPLLLSEVENQRDQCVARLQDLLCMYKGIEKVHIKPADGQAQLCIYSNADWDGSKVSSMFLSATRRRRYM